MRAPWALTTVVLLCLFVLAACVFRFQPQEWPARRGPVVPHATFPGDCSLCHTSEGWNVLRDDFTFDHAAETGYALVGAHDLVECLLCHNDRGPVQQFSRHGCVGCHVDPHQGRLGRTCDDCHDEESWIPRELALQHALGRFPLFGAHAVAPCFACHAGAEAGNFQREDTRCESCHQDDLVRAVSPNHVAQGWTTECGDCHTPTLWKQARFPHPSTLPLIGAHAAALCDACHTGGLFTGLNPDCVSCHLTEYQASTSPNHMSAGFPTDCDACHNTAGWSGANFVHSRVNRGDHGGLDCADCHEVPSNYAIFTCTNCHEHTQSDMDDEHDDVSGYLYSSSACFDCHPDGDD